MAMNSPCYKCEERCAGCHGNCDRYSLYTKKIEERNTKRREYLKKEQTYYDIRFSRMSNSEKLYGRK